MRLLFVTFAGHAFGFGHLSRCLSLAAAAARRGETFEFVVFGDASVAAHMERSGHAWRLLPATYLAYRPAIRSLAIGPFDVAIVDVIHARFFEAHAAGELFTVLRSTSRIVAAIDSLGDNSIAGRIPQAEVDVLIVPYIASGEDLARIDKVGARRLQGSDYALLSEDYVSLGRRIHRDPADRVLVSCGGSDPGRWTLPVLDGLERISQRLAVRVIVGPLFDAGLREAVIAHARQSKHEVTVVAAPQSLVTHMLWCDLAIAASGLTKYELAASATPTILFSIDMLHDAVNRPFAAMGSVIDLRASPTPDRIAEEAERLLMDGDERRRMAAKGRELVDGRGAERLLSELEKELSCLASR